MDYPKFKAAAVLASPIFLDREATTEKACKIIEEAAQNGAELVALPETFIPSYPWWVWMGINNVKRGELFRRLFDNAVEVPSETTDALCNCCKKNNIMAVVGINELGGTTIYNTQLFISRKGVIMGKHRKLMPSGEEKTVWGWGDGSDLKVYDTEFGKIGGLICYEHSMCLSKYALFAMGEQIHVACWPGANFKSQPRDRNKIQDAAIRDITFEGQVFCISSCSLCSEEEVNIYIELDPSNEGILEPGGGWAGIVDPMGNYVAGPLTNEEGIVYGEIDLAKIIPVKHMVDSIGHYARPDVFTLRLNHSKNVPFELVGSPIIQEEVIVENDEVQEEEV